jgi:hypothetical protein
LPGHLFLPLPREPNRTARTPGLGPSPEACNCACQAFRRRLAPARPPARRASPALLPALPLRLLCLGTLGARPCCCRVARQATIPLCRVWRRDRPCQPV